MKSDLSKGAPIRTPPDYQRGDNGKQRRSHTRGLSRGYTLHVHQRGVGRHRMIGHAEIQIGDSRIMISDESAEMDFRSPDSIGGSPVHIYLSVEDVDRIYGQALAAGAKSLMALEDQFWGDRTGTVVDPFGHRWYVSTHKEDLTEEELNARVAKLSEGS